MVSQHTQFDNAVYDQVGNLLLVVEAKKLTGKSAPWVGQLFRNWMVHGLVPPVEYFLLVLPDQFHLWHHPLRSLADSLPHRETIAPQYTAPAETILAPYAERIGYTLQEISGPGFEWLVFAWLEDIVRGTITRERAQQTLTWMVESGLYDSIRGGRVAAETIA